jgi:hypothetical protein
MIFCKLIPCHDFNERTHLAPTSKKPARRPTGKVHLSATASGLTSQAGLIPVIKFLERRQPAVDT